MDFFGGGDDKIKQEYSVISRIAEGAFGTVFKAVKRDTQRVVAIKELYSSQNKKSKSIIEREIAILQELEQHENVVQLIEIQMSPKKYSLVMEFVDFDLKQFIEASTYPISHSKVKRIAYQILCGLAHIHTHGIIHRDLKPSNILLTKEFIVKIGDFGSAIKEEAKKDKQFSIEGFTRWYKSPEQLFGSREYTSSIDIWSFACIFYELIQGYPLFHGNNEIEQIALISDVLGSPCEENWPSIKNMPDYGKIIFKAKERVSLRTSLPQADESEIQFIELMLKYENRPSAAEVCFALTEGVQNFIYQKQLLESSYFKNPEVPLKLKKKTLNLPKKVEDNPYFNYLSLLKNQKPQSVE